MSSAEFVKLNLKEHLSQVLVPQIADGLWSLYDAARELCDRNRQVDQTLRTFQNLLTQIPGWSAEKLEAEVERISAHCEYMDDLLMGVFLAYIRAFASLQYQGESPHVDLNFERPSVDKFIHEMYKHSARAAWKSAFLFKTIGSTAEQQARNRRDIEVLLDKCLADVINAFIPWKEISRAYFHTPVVKHEPIPEPVREPEPEPEKPKVQFEVMSEDEESDADSEDSHHGAKATLQLGEDVKLVLEDEEEEDEINLDTLQVQDTLEIKL